MGSLSMRSLSMRSFLVTAPGAYHWGGEEEGKEKEKEWRGHLITRTPITRIWGT